MLGYFHITDMWKERQRPRGANKEVKIWRIRLEKADLSEPSWWAGDIDDATQTDSPSPKAPVAKCAKCGTQSKEIFTAGWFCLNHNCTKYYTFRNGKVVKPTGLKYTEIFLNERTPFVGEIPPIRPPVPNHDGLYGTELSLRRGFVCPDCGCCNRRVYWNRWVCENKSCHYTRVAPMLHYPEQLLASENARFDAVMEKRRDTYGVNINALNEPDYIFDPFATIYQRGYLSHSQTLKLGGFQVRQYFLPDKDGRVLGSFSIFRSSDEVNGKPWGPDDIFRKMEVTDIGLRRNPAAVVGRE